VLTEANLFGWSWRAVFFVNIPVAAGALIAGLRFVPETKDTGARRPDVPGAVLLAASLVAIVYPLLEGRTLGWPAWVWVLLVAGLAGLGVQVAFSAGMQGFFLAFALWLQAGEHFSPLKAGLTADPAVLRPNPWKVSRS